MQCCICPRWVHLRCSQLFLSKIGTLSSSHSWNYPCCVPSRNTVTLSSYMYTSTVQSSTPLLMLHSRPTPVFKPLIPVCPFCIFPLCPRNTVSCSWLSFYASCLFSPPTLSEFFNGILEVFEPGAVNYFTFFRPMLLILCASRNPISTHLPLFGFLDFLLCVLITPTPGLAFSLLMPRTLAAASLFS